MTLPDEFSDIALPGSISLAPRSRRNDSS